MVSRKECQLGFYLRLEQFSPSRRELFIPFRFDFSGKRSGVKIGYSEEIRGNGDFSCLPFAPAFYLFIVARGRVEIRESLLAFCDIFRIT